MVGYCPQILFVYRENYCFVLIFTILDLFIAITHGYTIVHCFVLGLFATLIPWILFIAMVLYWLELKTALDQEAVLSGSGEKNKILVVSVVEPKSSVDDGNKVGIESASGTASSIKSSVAGGGGVAASSTPSTLSSITPASTPTTVQQQQQAGSIISSRSVSGTKNASKTVNKTDGEKVGGVGIQ